MPKRRRRGSGLAATSLARRKNIPNRAIATSTNTTNTITSTTTTSTNNASSTPTTSSKANDANNTPSEVAKLKRRMIERVLSHKKRNGNDAFNLDQLVDGWLELESDPGTFSLLIEDFGCFGAQVDEVYDLDQKFDGPVYGFIFLFKWLNNHQSERSLRNQSKSYNDLTHDINALASTSTTMTTHNIKGNLNLTTSVTNNANTINNINGSNDDASLAESQQQAIEKKCLQQRPTESPQISHSWSYVVDENIISDMFFAKQMISNSCATHALISVLLNCDRTELTLGPTLTRLKEHTKVMNPENKGYAIGNLPELAKAHNSHASYSSLYCRDRPQQRGVSFVIRGNQRTNLQQLQNQPETYHFVSYIPIKNRLYELDGLKNYPIDHGPIDPNEDWTEKFRRVIKQRLLDNKTGSEDPLNEIRYNLMAVVPDKRIQLKAQHKRYERHLKSTLGSLQQLTKNADGKKAPVNSANSTLSCGNNDATNRPSSPISNGTLTASETGSLCNSPKHLCDGDTLPSSSDIDIPNPPYSPLSNDTLSASETGSNPGSPSQFDDSFLYDEQTKIEKYFFVKFDTSNRLASEKEKVKDVTATSPIMATTATTTESSTNTGAVTSQEATDLRLDAMENMRKISKQLQRDIEKNESSLKEEYDKRRKYKIDNSRRTHNYEPFIMTFLSLLAKQGNLADLIEKDLGVTPTQVSTPATTALPLSASTAATTITTNTINSSKQQQPVVPVSHAKNREAVTDVPPPILTSQRGRPIRQKTKTYKYVSTGKPRGRPRKLPG